METDRQTDKKYPDQNCPDLTGCHAFGAENLRCDISFQAHIEGLQLQRDPLDALTVSLAMN